MDDQVQSGQQAASQANGSKSAKPWQADASRYAIVAFVVTCFFVIVNKSSVVRDAGFFLKVLSVLGGTALGTVGALVGNALRKAVLPDAVWTTGGFWGLLKTKIFWTWGPQSIGMLIGILVGMSMVLS